MQPGQHSPILARIEDNAVRTLCKVGPYAQWCTHRLHFYSDDVDERQN